jgi:hypothetical protein
MGIDRLGYQLANAENDGSAWSRVSLPQLLRKFAVGAAILALLVTLASCSPDAVSGDGDSQASSFDDLGLHVEDGVFSSSDPLSVVVPLAPGAGQGEPTWYAVESVLTVRGLNNLAGHMYVEATWEGRSFLTIGLDPVNSDGHEQWTKLFVADSVNGPTELFIHQDEFRLSFANFPQIDGVHGGDNLLQYSSNGATAGVSTSLSNASRVVTTPRGPTRAMVRSGNWNQGSESVKASAEIEVQVRDATWAIVSAETVFEDGTRDVRSLQLDGADATVGSHNVWIATMARKPVKRVNMFVESPGGGDGPVEVHQASPWWALSKLQSSVPWAVLLILAFPVLWVSASNLRRRPAIGNLSLVLALVLFGAAGSLAPSHDSKQSDDTLSHLPVISREDIQRLAPQLTAVRQAGGAVGSLDSLTRRDIFPVLGEPTRVVVRSAAASPLPLCSGKDEQEVLGSGGGLDSPSIMLLYTCAT